MGMGGCICVLDPTQWWMDVWKGCTVRCCRWESSATKLDSASRYKHRIHDIHNDTFNIYIYLHTPMHTHSRANSMLELMQEAQELFEVQRGQESLRAGTPDVTIEEVEWGAWTCHGSNKWNSNDCPMWDVYVCDRTNARVESMSVYIRMLGWALRLSCTLGGTFFV